MFNDKESPCVSVSRLFFRAKQQPEVARLLKAEPDSKQADGRPRPNPSESHTCQLQAGHVAAQTCGVHSTTEPCWLGGSPRKLQRKLCAQQTSDATMASIPCPYPGAGAGIKSLESCKSLAVGYSILVVFLVVPGNLGVVTAVSSCFQFFFLCVKFILLSAAEKRAEHDRDKY